MMDASASHRHTEAMKPQAAGHADEAPQARVHAVGRSGADHITRALQLPCPGPWTLAAMLLGLAELGVCAPRDLSATPKRPEMTDTRPLPPGAANTGRWEEVYANEPWYLKQAGEEMQFSGVLARAPDSGLGSAMQRAAVYRLGDRPVYTGGQTLPALEARVGRPVLIRGKAVAFPLEGQQVQEIWPAAVRSHSP